MENISTETVNTESNLILNSEAMSYLNGIRKWTKFFAIMGAIGIGLMIVLALTIGTIFAALNDSMYNQSMPVPTFFITIIYLFFAGLYVYPTYTLFKFSSEMKLTLSNKDSMGATRAFKFLNNHFQYVGILSIVIMSLYILVFLFGTLMAGLF